MENGKAAEVRHDDPFIPRGYRVVRRRREFADTVTLELMPISGARPAFTPGQFNMLYAFGIGEAAISLSGNADAHDTFVHTVRDVGAVSGALARAAAGAIVGVRGPFGTGWPMEAAAGADVVMVAGGLGLAPLRPAIREILANRGRYGRVTILFGCRHPSEMLYRSELEQWRRRLDIDVEVTVDHADAGWRGHVGVVPSLIARAEFDGSDATALICGPEVMMRYSIHALRDKGLPAERIYLSMERNMKCAIGLCGHCQFGPAFVCKEGPVLRYDTVADFFTVREI
ncbi:FAD/NAD(P)-binding protein (plasmid) [Burkholderia thailandensis]|nr:FAD/NAD(P)-binding protein [Burkholderia thailandensis]MBS2132195.1 FAD/NAD(P)-binding protein [Burkholderia thailandensis]QRA15291.1 FAD/NAD(P)-binding protein [Burkholderia thailandensis]